MSVALVYFSGAFMKKSSGYSPKPLFYMVRLEGLEPPTYGLEGDMLYHVTSCNFSLHNKNNVLEIPLQCIFLPP